jgi:NAD(P)H dehydrogenase (quinone)
MRQRWPCSIPALLLFGALRVHAGVPSDGTSPGCWHAKAVHVLVAYVSVGGHTRDMAADVARGATSATRACVWLLAISDDTPTAMLAQADAIVLGAPVHNGNPASLLLRWIERWPFKGEPLRDRIGATFVTAGGASAGAESSLLALQRSLLTFGMLIAGGEHWTSAYGAVAVNADPPAHETAGAPQIDARAFALGHRVAVLAASRTAVLDCATPQPGVPANSD